ncbi:MAG: recombinase family protein [Oenococcus oeni]
MTVIGYARVSTFGQDLNSQIADLKSKGAEKVYSEKFTGTKVDRPIFDQVLAELKSGDTLMVTKLDRFARNTLEAQQVIRDLFNRRVSVYILNMGVIEDSPTGRLIFSIFSAFAEFERDMIVTRTQEGKAYARAHNPNFREGRPLKYTRDQLDLAMELLQTLSYNMVAKKTGISKSTLIRERHRRQANSK